MYVGLRLWGDIESRDRDKERGRERDVGEGVDCVFV